MIDLFTAAGVAFITGLVSAVVGSLVTTTAIKVELRWVKREVARAHQRLDLRRAPDVAGDQGEDYLGI